MTTLAVYDCMLFFRAAARPRLARTLFGFVHSGRVTLCLGPDVLAEIRDVLTRPKLVAKYPALTKQAIDAFLAQQLRMATWISNVPEHYVLARDPDDSKYLNLAIFSSGPPPGQGRYGRLARLLRRLSTQSRNTWADQSRKHSR